MMTKAKSLWRRHPVAIVAGVVMLGCLSAAGWAGASMFRLDPVVVDWELPAAPQLSATGSNQTVYRIDPSRSTASYRIGESLAGKRSTATGTTKGIAGDILVDDSDPAASKVGEIVVNVEQLKSDKSLRDERLRQDYLRSHEYPLVRFQTTKIDGLPGDITDGDDQQITLVGRLTVKDETRPAEIAATVRREDGELHIKGSTEIRLSDFGVGPISIIGLVKTDDEATLGFDLVAPKAENLRIERKDAELAALPVASGNDPKFSKTVQPVLEASCATCHQPGGSGSGTWELATAADASRIASGIGLATESRYMPPWLASDQGVALKHSPRLSDKDLAAVSEWVKAGGPLDVDPATRIEADDVDGPQLRTDMELKLPEPYTGSVDKENDYRCFIMDPKLTEPAAITGYQFKPDQLPIVHHALVYRVRASSRPGLEQAEARDDKPGWECFGSINVAGAGLSPTGMGGGVDLLMGWAPGQPPSIFPEGAAIHLEPGDLLVTQMHYHVSEDPPPDQSAMDLQLAQGDPAALDDIAVSTYLAPAEIPCLPEDAGVARCDRDEEIKALATEYGPQGPIIANGLNLVCGTTPEELGKLDDGVASAACDHRVSNTGQVLAVLGHMHEIGKTFRMILNPDTPDEKVLLDIPRWDFDWQFNYALDEDITLERGDVIRVECSWDRALVDPTAETHYISWAEGTEDEMCYSTLATRVPRG